MSSLETQLAQLMELLEDAAQKNIVIRNPMLYSFMYQVTNILVEMNKEINNKR